MLLFTVMGIISVCNLLAFYIFSPFLFFKSRSHCARDSAHVVANPIQPDPSNTSSINQTGN